MKKISKSLIVLILGMMCAVLPISAGANSDPLVDLLSTDFEELPAAQDTYTGAQIETATGMPMALNPAARKASIIEETGGNKVIRFKTTTAGDTVDSLHTYTSPLKVGTIEAGFEFLPITVPGGAWHFFMISSSANASTNTVITYMGGGFKKTSNSSPITTPDLNANGRYQIRFKISRVKTTDDWNLAVYDETSETERIIYSATIPASSGNITKIQPIRYYAGNGEGLAIFDNYFIKTTRLPDVASGGGCEGAQPDDDELKITFNAPLPNPEDVVTLVKPGVDDDEDTTNDTLVINTDTSYNAQTNELTIMPKSYLEYATTYNVVFSEGGVNEYSFTTAAAALRITSQTTTFLPDGGSAASTLPTEGVFDVTHTVSVSNDTTFNKNGTVIFICLNDKGLVMSLSMEAIACEALDTDSVTITVEDLDASRVKSVVSYVWESVESVGYLKIH